MGSLSTFLKGIADAIRAKKGTTDTINASNFATEISNIQTGSTATGTITINDNGTYDVADKATAVVNVSADSITMQQYLQNLFNGKETRAEKMFQGDKLKIAQTFIHTTFTNAKFYYCNYMFAETDITSVNYEFKDWYTDGSGYKWLYCQYAFQSCNKLITAKIKALGNYEKMLNTSSMFQYCTALKEVELIDGGTSGYFYMQSSYSMFNGCTSLEKITGDPLSCHYRTQNHNGGISGMFTNCKALKEVRFKYIAQGNMQLGSGTTWGHLLSVDSLLSAIQACVKDNTQYTLTVGTANMAKLADTYVKLTSSTSTTIYPFEVCESTDEGAMTIRNYLALKNWTIA